MWWALLLSPVFARFLAQQPAALDCNCDCCTSADRTANSENEGNLKCIPRLNPGDTCSAFCTPPREGGQVILGSTGAGVPAENYCILNCMATDMVIGGACRSLDYEERLGQITDDGLGSDQLVGDVATAEGHAEPPPPPPPPPTTTTPMPGDLKDLMAATKRAKDSSDWARSH